MSCEGCWETAAVRYPEIDSEPTPLEKMLSISVLELLITIVVCVKRYETKKIRGIN